MALPGAATVSVPPQDLGDILFQINQQLANLSDRLTRLETKVDSIQATLDAYTGGRTPPQIFQPPPGIMQEASGANMPEYDPNVPRPNVDEYIEYRNGYRFCRLCHKFADDNHLRTDQHLRRIQWPQNYLYD